MPPVNDKGTRLVLLAIIALGMLLVMASVTLTLAAAETRVDMWWTAFLGAMGGGLVGVGIGML